MPMQVAVSTYSGANKLTPLYNSKGARKVPVNLSPSTTYAAGTVLGQITSSANDVQTITAPGSSTYILSGVNPITGNTFTTSAIAYNAVDATVQAAIILAVAASGTTGVGITVASLAVTFAGQFAAMPVQLMTTTAGSVAHTTTGRSAKTYKAYASGSSDGSQAPCCILEYAVTTDASGNINSSPFFSYQGQPSTPAFFSGTFDCADLVGLDTNAVTKLGGHLVAGTVTAGTFTF